MYHIKGSFVFVKNLKKLSKKYRHIKQDIEPLLGELENGNFVGDVISGFENRLYKTRVPSSDQRKGKSGGFRVIYYLILNKKEVVLLTMYVKAKQTDIRKDEILKILSQLL